VAAERGGPITALRGSIESMHPPRAAAGRRGNAQRTRRNLFSYLKYLRHFQERPYHVESTASRLLSEVKQRRAWLVLRWGTTLESQVLFFFITKYHNYPRQISCQTIFCLDPVSILFSPTISSVHLTHFFLIEISFYLAILHCFSFYTS
jgi:hypothetical protein